MSLSIDSEYSQIVLIVLNTCVSSCSFAGSGLLRCHAPVCTLTHCSSPVSECWPGCHGGWAECCKRIRRWWQQQWQHSLPGEIAEAAAIGAVYWGKMWCSPMRCACSDHAITGCCRCGQAAQPTLSGGAHLADTSTQLWCPILSTTCV